MKLDCKVNKDPTIITNKQNFVARKEEIRAFFIMPGALQKPAVWSLNLKIMLGEGGGGDTHVAEIIFRGDCGEEKKATTMPEEKRVR